MSKATRRASLNVEVGGLGKMLTGAGTLVPQVMGKVEVLNTAFTSTAGPRDQGASQEEGSLTLGGRG